VTSAGRGDATFEKVAFLALGISFRERRSEFRGRRWISHDGYQKCFLPRTRTCHRRTFPVVSELPIERLTRATQAWGRASSPPSKQISSGSSIGRKLYAAKAHIGQGIIREKRRPRRIDSGERAELNNDSCVRNGSRILTGAQGVESQGQMRGDRFKNGTRSHSSHGDREPRRF
jgi:hypothetical protein